MKSMVEQVLKEFDVVELNAADGEPKPKEYSFKVRFETDPGVLSGEEDVSIVVYNEGTPEEKAFYTNDKLYTKANRQKSLARKLEELNNVYLGNVKSVNLSKLGEPVAELDLNGTKAVVAELNEEIKIIPSA